MTGKQRGRRERSAGAERTRPAREVFSRKLLSSVDMSLRDSDAFSLQVWSGKVGESPSDFSVPRWARWPERNLALRFARPDGTGERRAELKNYELTPPMQGQERRGRRLTSADLESFAETTEGPHEAGERGERLAGRQGRRPGQLEEERGAAEVPHLEQGNQWMRMLARTPARLFPSPSGRYHL